MMNLHKIFYSETNLANISLLKENFKVKSRLDRIAEK